ncbi:MAG: hypothetical protein IPN14_17040 [Bacteroidetes bacterium]|nr:hypothetical protein [Bacteroidota bacterium]
MEQQYIAISFGPIARTIEAATKTREIWMASYMISHLSKCFCEEVGRSMRN